jgi:hypothetical protein
VEYTLKRQFHIAGNVPYLPPHACRTEEDGPI